MHIKEVIDKHYKEPSPQEKKFLDGLYQLEHCLNKVGGDGRGIISRLPDISAADLVDTLIMNGITFEVKKEKHESMQSNNCGLGMTGP